MLASPDYVNLKRFNCLLLHEWESILNPSFKHDVRINSPCSVVRACDQGRLARLYARTLRTIAL